MSMVAPGSSGWLIAICLSRVGAYMVYIAYAATLPVLQGEWQLSGTAAATVAVACAVLLYRTPQAAALHQRRVARSAATSVPAR